MEESKPLWSKQAEMAVLGSVLLDNNLLDEIASELSAEDFYSELSRKVFAAYLTASKDGRSIEPVSMGEYLPPAEYPMEFWLQLEGAVLSTASLKNHIAVVKERSRQRQLQARLYSLWELARNGSKPEETIARAQAIIDGAQSAEASTISHISDCMTGYNELLDSVLADGIDFSGIPTDFPRLNELTNGLRPGGVYIVAARPGVGKTALACQMMVSTAGRHRQPTLFFSAEMPRHEIVSRFLARESGIHLTKVMTMKSLWQTEEETIGRIVRKFHGVPLWIDDTSCIDVGMLIARAKAWARRLDKPPGPIFIDYVQLLQNKDCGRDASKVEKLEDISVRIKNLSRTIPCPIVLLAQIRRSGLPAGKKEPWPRLEDLKGSGALEQDADVAILMHVDSLDEEAGTSEIVLDVAKNRNGPQGVCRTLFDGAHMKFTQLLEEEEA